MKTSQICVAAACVMFLLTSCGKPTVKSENSRFNRSEKEVKGYAAVYPGFSKLLKARLAKATEAKKSAEGLKDEEAKIAAMAKARNVLTEGFVNKLSSIDADLKKLRKDANSVVNEVKSEADRLSAKNASEDAQRVLKNADELFKKDVEDETAAEAILARIQDEIRSSKANIKKVIDSARAAQKKVTKPTSKDAAKSKPATTDSKPSAATWKCTYCKSANKADVVKCASCNASK